MQQHRLTRRPIVIVGNAPDPGSRRRPATRAIPSAHELLYMVVHAVQEPSRRWHGLCTSCRGIGCTCSAGSRPATRERLVAFAPPVGALVIHDGTSEADYLALLETATALVTTSLDEASGFRWSRRCRSGLRWCVSDIPIFREIGGEAALYAPATMRRRWHPRSSLEDPSEWEARSIASRAQAARFSWDRSAETLAGGARGSRRLGGGDGHVKLVLDLHDIYNRHGDIDRALHAIIEEAIAKEAPWSRSSPKGTGALKKRVLRFPLSPRSRHVPPRREDSRRTSAASSCIPHEV